MQNISAKQEKQLLINRSSPVPNQLHNDQSFESKEDLEGFEITPIGQTKIVDSKLEFQSSDNLKNSSIQIVIRPDGDQIPFLDQNNQNLAASSAQLVDTQIAMPEKIQSKKNPNDVSNGKSSNKPALMNNQTEGIKNQQNYQKNEMRYSIDYSIDHSKFIPLQTKNPVNSNPVVNIRSTLPANTSCKQFAMPKQTIQLLYGPIAKQQIFHPSMKASQPQNVLINRNGLVVQPQQIPRIPQNLPLPPFLNPFSAVQSQIQTQQLNSQKNGPQRFEANQYLSKNTNPTINQLNPPVNYQIAFQRTNQRPQTMIAQRFHSSDGVFMQAKDYQLRSLGRRSSNIIFKLKTQQDTQKNSSLLQALGPVASIVKQQDFRSKQFSPGMNAIVPQLNPQKVSIPQSLLRSNSQKASQFANKQPSKLLIQQDQWKQRYFALYTKLESINRKVEFLIQQIHVYDQMVESLKSEKTLKKHKKTISVIHQLKQQFASIMYKWKPTSQFKIPQNIPQLNKNNQMKPFKSINSDQDKNHLEMKYKRLLFNYSKLQEENHIIKTSFQRKIEEVVKNLQTQNYNLKNKLSQTQNRSQLIPSDELTLSTSLKFQLEDKATKYDQQNKFLKDQIQNLTNKNDQLIKAIKHLQSMPPKVSQVPSLQSPQISQTIGMNSIETIIEQLNGKIRQYQLRLAIFQQEHQALENKNHQLEQSLAKQSQKIHSMQKNQEKVNLSSNLALNQQIEQKEKQLKAKQQELIMMKAEMKQIQSKSIDLEQNLVRQIEKKQGALNELQTRFAQTSSQLKQKTAELGQKNQLQILNQKLKFQLEIKNKEISQLKAQNLNIKEDTETRFKEELNKVNSKVLEFEKELFQAKEQLKISNTVQPVQEVKFNSMYEQLQLENCRLHQCNTSQKDQLERANNQIVALANQLNEKQAQQSSAQIKITQLESQCKNYEQQIIDYKAVQSSIFQTASQSPLLIQQYEFTINTLRSQITRKQSQIERQSCLSDQRIQDLTELLKLSYKQRQSLQKKFQEKALLLQSQRQKKQTLIRELRDKVFELEHKKHLSNAQQTKQIDYYNKMPAINDTKQGNKLSNELQKLKNQNEKISKDSQIESKKLNEQIQQLTQDNLRLKKQISEFALTVNELESTADALTKKNAEILSLKHVSFQNQKLVLQNINFKRELQSQMQQNSRLAAENDKLNKLSIQLSRNIKEIQANFNALKNSFQQLQANNTLLKQTVMKKDTEINSLKHAAQQLQNKLQSNTKQNEKLAIKISALQIKFEQQANLFKNQTETLKSRQTDYDNMIRQKSVSDYRIIQLQSCKQKYQYQLKQNEQLITKHKSKVKLLSSQKQDLVQQLQIVNEKTKQSERKISENSKKYKKTIEELQQKNKLLQQQQIIFEKDKISQLQTDIKAKQNKIWKLQKQLEEVLERLDEVGEQQINNRKIIILQQKLKEYQARLFNQTFKYNPLNHDFQAMKVFEKKVIYELKKQNQKLKQFLNKKRVMKPTNDKKQNLSPSQAKTKEAYDEQLDEIQVRLVAFNSKLQNLISHGNDKNVEISPKKAKSQSIQKIDTSQVNGMDGNEFKIQSKVFNELKLKYAELERYCKNIEIELLSGKPQKSGFQSNRVVAFHQSITNDQAVFLKNKNKQLEDRVDKLLAINNELKNNIENLLNQKSQPHISFYKRQINEFELKITEQDQRFKKLLEENDKIKSQLSHKPEENAQVKIFDQERKSLQLQRIINELTLTKSSLQRQLSSRSQLLQTKEREIQELKNQISLYGEKELAVISSYKEKLQKNERQMVNLANKIRVNESQIERLNENIAKRKLETNDETNRLKAKISQQQEEINRRMSEKEGEKTSSQSFKIETSKQSKQIKLLQYRNRQQKQDNDIMQKKLQQLEQRCFLLKKQIEEKENQLVSQKFEERQTFLKLEQQEQELFKAKNQAEYNKLQIIKLHEDAKNQQNQYEIELQSLLEKLALTEKEHFNSKLSASESSSQLYSRQAEIHRLKSQVKKQLNEIQELNQNHTNKQRLYEQKINTLKSQITKAESISTGQKQKNKALQNQRERLEQQILQLKNQISILKSQTVQLAILLKEKQSSEQYMFKSNSQQIEQQEKYQKEFTKLSQQNLRLKDQIERLKETLTKATGRSSNLETERIEKELVKVLNQNAILKQQNQRLNAMIKQIQQSSKREIKILTDELEKALNETEKFRITNQKLKPNSIDSKME